MSIPASRALANIGKGKLANGYLLMGSQLYWRDRIWAGLRKATGLEKSTESLLEMDLKHCSVDQVLGAAMEQSLWSSQRLILVPNAHLLSGPKNREALKQYFQSPNPSSILVFEMMDTDPESEDWREREKAKGRVEAWEDVCTVVLLNSPGMGEAVELVQKEAEMRNLRMEPDAAGRLVLAMDRDLARLVNEVEKLALYKQGQETITGQDVALMVGGEGGTAAVSITEAIGTGDTLKLLEAVAETKQQYDYLPLLVGEVARYLRQLILLRDGRPRDSRQASGILWGARLPAPPNLVPELLRQAKRFSTNHLLRCLKMAQRTDMALRSSPVDEGLIFERFVLGIAKPLQAGNQRTA